MKKKFLLMTTLILLSVGMTHALNETDTNAIDQVITRWHARQPQNTLISRVKSILTRIDDIQTRARMTQKTAEILEHIEMRLQKILLAAQTPGGITSGTVIPPRVQNSSTFPQSITIPTQRETHPLIIGGGGPTLMSVIEFTVATEAMLIDTITLSTSRDELPEYIAEAALYDDSGNLIKTTTITNDVITFDGFSLEKKPGSHKMYVSIIPFRNDSSDTPAPLSFSSATYGIQAQGAITRTKIQKVGTVGQSTFTTVTIAPVGINTVQFVSNRAGSQSNTILSNGTNIVGILEITTPAIISRYSKDLIIDTITLTVNDGTTAKNVASLLRLERINNGSSNRIAGSVQGNTVTFTLTNENTINTIQQGQSLAFLFTADLTLDPSVRESVQLTIANLKQGGITYHAKNNTSTISTVQQWNWQSEAVRVSE